MERRDAPDDRRFDPIDDEVNAELADGVGTNEAWLGSGIEDCPGEVCGSRRSERLLTREDLGMTNDDTGGEFVSPSQAATSRAANREQRVRETGAPAHQSSSRITLSAAAVRTCCRWAFA